MIRALLICAIAWIAVMSPVTARGGSDEDDEDLQATRYAGDGEKFVVTYADIANRAEYPGDDVLKHIRAEWRDVEAKLRPDFVLKVRGRLYVDEGGKARPVNWFQGITVLLNVGPQPHVDWSTGFDADTTASGNVLLRADGTFTASIPLTNAPRKPGTISDCQAGVVLARPDGLKMVYQSAGVPLPATIAMLALPAGPELDLTLQVINAASRWPHHSANPTAIIKAVNSLQALGKRNALDALRKYIAIAPDGFFDNDRVAFDPANIDQGDFNVAFWITRLLFEPGQAGMRIPQPMIGAAVPHPAKSDERLWPLFPIELVDDVPFMIAEGWNLGGLPEHPSSHIAWAERYGVIRDAPLRPADDPFAATGRLLWQPKSQRLKLRTDHIREQAWQFASNVLPMPERPLHRFQEIEEKQWDDVRWTAAEKHIHWDEKSQAYALGAVRK